MPSRGPVNSSAIHFLAVLAALCPFLLGAAGHDPIEVLRRATAKVRQTSARLPNYTCVETIEREFFYPAARSLPRSCSVILEQRKHPTLDMMLRPYSSDRLRLDVALVKRGEIFSWAGASRFNEDSIDHLVRQGPMGTGAFGGFLVSIFNSDVRKFTFTREVVVDGRDLMEYSFAVPRSDSHYRVKVRDSWELTGYSGTFELDPETGEVAHLEVETEELPPLSGMCQTTTYLDYATLPIGSSQFLLPTRVRQHWVDPFGKETQNTTAFTACREYKGESTLIFPEDPTSLSTAGSNGDLAKESESTASDIPPGLRLKLELTSPIDTDTAAAGDRFTGRLIEPVRGADKKLLFAKGTVVEGRLLRVESFVRPPCRIVVLRPRWLDVKGSRRRLACMRDWEREMQKTRNQRKKGLDIQLPLPGEERSGVFRFEGAHVMIPKGFRSEWRTVAVPPPDTASH